MDLESGVGPPEAEVLEVCQVRNTDSRQSTLFDEERHGL